jgi:hypothetical protein
MMVVPIFEHRMLVNGFFIMGSGALFCLENNLFKTILISYQKTKIKIDPFQKTMRKNSYH